MEPAEYIYQKRFGTHPNTTLRDSGIFGHFRGFSGVPFPNAKLHWNLAFFSAFLGSRLGHARGFFLCFSCVCPAFVRVFCDCCFIVPVFFHVCDFQYYPNMFRNFLLERAPNAKLQLHLAFSGAFRGLGLRAFWSCFFRCSCIFACFRVFVRACDSKAKLQLCLAFSGGF